MELETINKLFLELSQVATAITRDEHNLANMLEIFVDSFEDGSDIPLSVVFGAKGMIARTRIEIGLDCAET